MKYLVPHKRLGSQGFTLIELMVTVAIIAILAGIAFPSYQNSVRKSHRIEAGGEVLAVAQRLEKIRSQTYSYLQGNSLVQDGDRYEIRSTATDTTYLITATPRASTDQVNDVCGVFSYNNTGEWTFANGREHRDCL